MFVFVSGRRTGKTRAIVEWWLESPNERAILVADTMSARNTWREIDKITGSSLPEYLVRSSTVIALEVFAERGRPFHGRKIGIDDLDRVLAGLFGIGTSIEYVTVNATLVPRPQMGPRQDYVEGEAWPQEEAQPRAIEPSDKFLDVRRYM